MQAGGALPSSGVYQEREIMANLSRQIRKPRQLIANSGQFGRLIPFQYAHVFAGESQHNIKTSLNFFTKPIKSMLDGATVDVWYYYVPWRLVWDEFPNWVMGDYTPTKDPATDNEATWTSSSEGNALFGTQILASQASMLADAYTMIVNQYFREEHDHYTVSTSPAVLPIVDRTAETQGDEDYEGEDETIDVSSGTLSIREIERKRAKLAYERRVESLDNKYTSFLRAQGVNANEAVAQIPEFLGHYRKYIKPQKTVNDSTGTTVQHYAHECTFSLTKRRFFQEHGVVIGCASIRPKVHLSGGYNADAAIWGAPRAFPHVGQLAENKKIQNAANFLSTGAGENETDFSPSTYLNIDHYLWHGRMHTIESDTNYFNAYDPTDDETALYPSAAWDAAVSSASGTHYYIDGVTSSKIATPLRRLKVV